MLKSNSERELLDLCSLVSFCIEHCNNYDSQLGQLYIITTSWVDYALWQPAGSTIHYNNQLGHRFVGSPPRFFRHSLGDVLKNLAQKGVGVRPLRPALDLRLYISLVLISYTSVTGMPRRTPTALWNMITGLSYQVYIPIKINNSRPKLLLFIFIVLVTEKNLSDLWNVFKKYSWIQGF